MLRNFCLVAAALVCLSAPPSASAYWPYLGYGGWYGYGNGWGYNAPSNYVPAPPYFAIHPPVYYSSQITARHYGASPFAWSPGMQPITFTPRAEGVSPPNPVMIQNPYVASAKATSVPAAENRADNRPLHLQNPHVASVSR